MYVYAGNNPVKYTDPDGRQTAGYLDLDEINQDLDFIAKSIPGLASALGLSLETGITTLAKASPWLLVIAFIFCLQGDSISSPRTIDDIAISPEEAKALLNKMELEIERIQSKDRGNKPTEQYALVAKSDGYYPNVRTGKGFYLARGDVWKYGQTSDPNGRYDSSYLENLNLVKVWEFSGTTEECLIMEKIKLYGYYINNGCLPPGNKIFR